MGEKITNLGWLRLPGFRVEVELNKGVTKIENIVHLQEKTFRIEMTETDFIKYSLTIIGASARLKAEKDIK